MLKRRAAAALAALGSLVTAPATAQLGVVGGVNLPVSSSVSDEFRTGWVLGAFYEYRFMNPTYGIRLDGSYGELKTKESLTFSGKDRFISGMVSFMVHFMAANPDATIDVYAGGGVGVVDARFSLDASPGSPSAVTESETKLGIQGTVGGALPVGAGSVAVVGEARWKSGFFSDDFGGSKSLLEAVLGFRVALGNR